MVRAVKSTTPADVPNSHASALNCRSKPKGHGRRSRPSTQLASIDLLWLCKNGKRSLNALSPGTDSWSKGGCAPADFAWTGWANPPKSRMLQRLFNCLNQQLASPTSSDIRVDEGAIC